MTISDNPSERPVLGGALVPVYIANSEANVYTNGAPVSEANPLPVSIDDTLPISIVEVDQINITGTFAGLGDNQILATPGVNYRIVVTAFLIQNESAVATTMILRSGATGNSWRALAQNQGDGFAMVFAIGRPWKLYVNEPLNLNLSAANQCNFSVMYYTEAV